MCGAWSTGYRVVLITKKHRDESYDPLLTADSMVPSAASTSEKLKESEQVRVLRIKERAQQAAEGEAA